MKNNKFEKKSKNGGGWCESAIFEQKVNMINLCNKTIGPFMFTCNTVHAILLVSKQHAVYTFIVQNNFFFTILNDTNKIPPHNMISWSLHWFIPALDEILPVGVCMSSRLGPLEGATDPSFFSDLAVSRSSASLRCEMSW